MVGNGSDEPTGLTIRTRTSPTSALTVSHCSSTSSFSVGIAWRSSRTFRACLRSQVVEVRRLGGGIGDLLCLALEVVI